MGSPFGPSLAKILDGFYRNKVFSNVQKPAIYFRLQILKNPFDPAEYAPGHIRGRSQRMESLRLRKSTNAGFPEDYSNLHRQDSREEKRCEPKLWHALVFTLFLYILYIFAIPCPIDPQPYITNYTIPRFEGVLKPNDRLIHIEKLYEGKILGPDSMVQDDQGNIYTGLADGSIAKLYRNGDVEEIARTGKRLNTCGTYDTEPECGRPLGLRFDHSKQNLIICDAYYGLLNLNLQSKVLTTLLKPDEGAESLNFTFMNDVVVGEGDIVYLTDSSWKWTRKDSRYAVLEATGRGRLVSFNLRTKKKRTLMTGLFIPNGLEISTDFGFLLVAETTSSRITRYYLKGPKSGTFETFAENLPGYPANLLSSPKGGYWLGLIAVRKWPFSFLDIAGPYPLMRRLLAKMMSQDTMTMLIPKYGMIIKLDEDGKVIESLHDPTGNVIDEITTVFEDKNDNLLYLGSYKHNFLGMLKLN